MTTDAAVPVVSLDLDAIEARAAAATERPWWDAATATLGHDVSAEVPSLGLMLVCGVIELGNDDGAADAAFIAHARSDVPALVDALRRAHDRAVALEQECAETRKLLDQGLFLVQYGERPPGAPRDDLKAETWGDWGHRVENWLRRDEVEARQAGDGS